MPTLKISVSPTKQKTKNTYCKKCGSPIDKKTRKCEGCGKQYFHLPKVTILRVALVVVIVGLIGLNVYQYIERNQTVTELNETLSRTIEINKDLREQRDDYSVKLMLAEAKLDFWNEHAVICTSEGKKYHHYGCGHLEGRSFYIFNVEYAESLGYTPCLDCFSSNGKLSDYIEKNS